MVDRSVLESFDSPLGNKGVCEFHTDELTAHCPFDFGGPDFYELWVVYVPRNLVIESRSLKRYIESFRDSELTAEGVAEEIYSALDEVIEPRMLYVRVEQARRGGFEQTVEVCDGV